MRYRRRSISTTYLKSPLDFKINEPDLDSEMIAVVTLWLFGGYSMREAWSIIYRPKCSPNSIPPQVSLFFGKKVIKETVRVMKYIYTSNPYINSKALDWEC